MFMHLRYLPRSALCKFRYLSAFSDNRAASDFMPPRVCWLDRYLLATTRAALYR